MCLSTPRLVPRPQHLSLSGSLAFVPAHGRTTQDAEDAVKVMNEFLALAEAWIKPKVEKLARR